MDYGNVQKRRHTSEEREPLGFIGVALTILGFIPQVRRLFRLRSAHEISLPLMIFFIVGIGFWLSYAISLGYHQ